VGLTVSISASRHQLKVLPLDLSTPGKLQLTVLLLYKGDRHCVANARLIDTGRHPLLVFLGLPGFAERGASSGHFAGG
jgi:hypothetical protein